MCRHRGLALQSRLSTPLALCLEGRDHHSIKVHSTEPPSATPWEPCPAHRALQGSMQMCRRRPPWGEGAGWCHPHRQSHLITPQGPTPPDQKDTLAESNSQGKGVGSQKRDYSQHLTSSEKVRHGRDADRRGGRAAAESPWAQMWKPRPTAQSHGPQP